MSNVIITDDSNHKMRYYGMATSVRNNDPFDNQKMRSKKEVEKFWEHNAPMYKKLYKDTKQFDNSNVQKIDPESNIITLDNGTEIEYKVLVIATGLSEDYSSIEGLKEAIVSKDEKGLRVGHALGHPAQFQNKAWYMNSGLDSKCSGTAPFVSYSPDGEFIGKYFQYPHLGMGNVCNDSIHAMEIDPRTSTIDQRFKPNDTENEQHPLTKQDKIIKNQTESQNTQTHWGKTLKKLDQESQTMHFEDGSTQNYRQLLINPPCKPAAFISDSGLSDEDGFLDVDPATLKHSKYKNIMGVGQCTNIHKRGTFTTLMGIMKMADVVCENACHMLHGDAKESTQDGHNISPIVLGTASSVVAETRYDYKEKEEFYGTAGISQSTPSCQGFEMIHTVTANYDKQIIAGSYYGGWKYTPDFGGH